MNSDKASSHNARRQRLDAIQSRDAYPEFYILPSEANPKWIDFICKKIQCINFDDRRHFTEFESWFYRLHRSVGYEAALKQLDELPDQGEVAGFKWSLRSHLGDIVFQMISDREWDQFCPRGIDTKAPIPVHDFEIQPYGQDFALRFSSLRRGPAGFYCSPRGITHNVDGVEKIIEFKPHAIERICERLTGYVKKYGAWGDAYAFIERCNYFETAKIYPDRLGLTFFQDCFLEQNTPHMFHFPSHYAFSVYGFIPQYTYQKFKMRWYYRVGYSPIDIKDKSIVLRTTLPPGYKSTPEYTMLRNSNLPEDEREELIRKTDGWSAEVLHKTMDYSLFKWFHKMGVEQVVPFEGDLFLDELPGQPTRKPSRIDVSGIPQQQS